MKKCQKAGHSKDNCWRDETCGKCSRKGHITSACERFKVKAVSLANIPAPDCLTKYPTGKVTDQIDLMFQPFVSKGYIGEDNGKVAVAILRDTACAQSLIVESSLPPSDEDRRNANYKGNWWYL